MAEKAKAITAETGAYPTTMPDSSPLKDGTILMDELDGLIYFWDDNAKQWRALVR